MVKKKSGAAKPKAPTGPGAGKEAVHDEPAADTVMQVLNRRIRAARKKIQKISVIEEAQATGKEINDDQVKTLASKVQVTAILEELARVEPLVEKALKKEIDGAVAKAVEESKARQDASEADEGEESSTVDSSSEQKHESDEAGQLLDLLYVSQVFGVGGTEADYEAFLAGQDPVQDGKPITRGDLEKLASFGKSLFTRAVEEGFTHEEALSRCKRMALTFIRSPDAQVDNETSVSEMMDVITKLKESDFFKREIITPAPEAPPEPVDVVPAEQLSADPVEEMDPTVNAPVANTDAVVVGHGLDPIAKDGAAPEPFDPAAASAQRPSQQQQPSSTAPRPFLPFPNMRTNVGAAPPVSPQPAFPAAPVPNPMGFAGPNPGAPGYMPQQSSYGAPAARDPPAEASMAPQHPPEAEPAAVEPEMVPAQRGDPLSGQSPPQAGSDQAMKTPQMTPLPQAPKPNTPQTQQVGLDARHRGPGGPNRRPRYDGPRQGGPGGQIGGQGYGGAGGGRGSNWNGYNNYGGNSGGGYRGGSSWEGRGRGRGRAGGNYGGGSNDGGGYGRGGPGGFSRGGRGRGGFRGGRGGGGSSGGHWNRHQYQQQSQPPAHE